MATKRNLYDRRRRRVRNRLQKRAGVKPRLSVFRSSKQIYAQIIDDRQGRTLAAASTIEKDLRGKLRAHFTRVLGNDGVAEVLRATF